MSTLDDSAKARKKEMNFAESVHQLVTELSEVDPTMMKWTSDGAAFTVNPSHPGLGAALSKYFQHSKYSSFQRQLNQYGWTKPRSGRYNGTFFNPSFRKDTNIEEVRKISRGGCKKHLRRASSAESENMIPLRTKPQSRKVSVTMMEEVDPSTPSPHRRRPRLPLQKRPVNFAVAKTVSPLTPKAIENPSADDMTAVQVLLGMVQKPSEESSPRPSDTTSIVSEVTKSSRSKGRNFALAVHELVTEADATNPTMIRWVQDGSAFEIDRSHPNLGKALAKYFQHSKYSSFQRQLNQYGWCKVRNTGKFFNQYFHKDKSKSNFDMIQRKDKKTDASPLSRGNRGTKRVSITSHSRSEVDLFNPTSAAKRRRRMSSISEPRLLPVSDEETISSEEGSIQSHQHVTFVDLTRPPSNVMAYLPHHSR